MSPTYVHTYVHTYLGSSDWSNHFSLYGMVCIFSALLPSISHILQRSQKAIKGTRRLTVVVYVCVLCLVC